MRCIVCGNEIKENSLECTICGSKQLGTPIYNTQQFTDLQHQINNMHINNNPETEVQNNYYGVNQPQPMVQQPMMQQPVQQNNYYQPTGYINPMQNGYSIKPNPTKGKDIAGLILSGFGIYYSLCVFSVVSSGIKEFIEKNLSDPKYAEILESKEAITGCITWPLFLVPIVSLLIIMSARKISKNTINTLSLIFSIITLVVGIVSSFYIYNNL